MITLFLFIIFPLSSSSSIMSEEEIAVLFMHEYNRLNGMLCNSIQTASWNYVTNITDINKENLVREEMKQSKIGKEIWKELNKFHWKKFNDPQLRRQFHRYSFPGDSVLTDDQIRRKSSIKADMTDIYSTTKICSFKNKNNCKLALDPDLTNILANSRNYDELVHVWKSWREKVGRPMKPLYQEFVKINNEAARLNGFKDAGDFQRDGYETPTFVEDLKNLWNRILPFYQQLHAYVRRKLILKYGSNKIKDDGPIPAHLLGNMWAQEWQNLQDVIKPYQNKPSLDVTPQMKAKKMSPVQIAKLAEEFFVSLGLKPMTREFWNKSLFEKPKDRNVVCHPSAWDFCTKKDFRIKLCMEPTMEYLISTHHEMGHVQYYMQYANQPQVFRAGANPGFHEAIGDVMALSVYTPSHLKSIKLLKDDFSDKEGDINFLLEMALKKLAFLPFGYILDLWRWGVYNGEIKLEDWNTKWWELRLNYQGLCPPVKRTETDFDPGAKYHVPSNTPYIRYFVSFVIQFQFHDALCRVSGFRGPLHKCDIYKSEAAGNLISKMMQMGASRPWSEAMKAITGISSMDAGPLLRYFEPLYHWLKETNKNETIGWKSADPTVCP